MNTNEIKPRLELRRDPDFGWTWYGLVELDHAPSWRTPFYLIIGTARYLTVADALAIYRNLH